MENLPPRSRPVNRGRTPALDAWRAELAEGRRTPTAFDWLWQAACCEQSAIEYEADGLPGIAEKFRSEAREIVHTAARSAPVAA
jgi:hypothetical protein